MSTYAGYLIKFGSVELPLKFIQSGTYKVSPNKRTDIDSYQDADGTLHRNVLPHVSSKIEFTTLPLNISEWEELMNILRSAREDDIERRYTIEFYDPEYCMYKSGTFYMPDFDYTINIIDNDNIEADGVRFAFIEY